MGFREREVEVVKGRKRRVRNEGIVAAMTRRTVVSSSVRSRMIGDSLNEVMDFEVGNGG